MQAVEAARFEGPTPQAWSAGIRSEYERSATIDDLFAQRARERPSAIAATGDGFELTYSQLERDANRIANHLESLGVRAGAAVGITLARSPDVPAALLGILKARAAYVPLDPSYPRERLASMIDDAGIAFVLARSADELSGTPATCVPVASAMLGSPERRPVPDARSNSLAYVMYTSGSTGRPKGVAVEHRNVVRLVRKTDYVEIATSDTLLHYAPLGFDASTFEIWGALLNGARLAIPAPGLQTMDELAATIERFGVTTLFLTTALFARFVDLTPAGSSPLRCVLTGGEVASGPHLRRFLESLPDCRLLHVYGPTENTTFSTFHALALADTNADNIPIGRPIANSSAYVLDEELRPLPAGAIGELCVGGDGVARGYLNAPELTAERFVADPFSEDPAARLYRTGDRARFRSDGALEFLGRSDGQVKVRGYRIELGEIETALRAAPGVRDAVAVVLERDGGKDIVAHVAASPGFGLDEGALRAHLARTLPRYTRPHRIIIHEELPLGPNGKLDRVALTRRAAPTGVPTRGTPPRFARDASALARERAVAGIWREVLGCEQDPGRDENFFDLGGDSLRLLTVHARLSERFGVRVCTTDLLEQTTIRKLAAFLEREEVRS